MSRYTPLKDRVAPVFPPSVAVVFGVLCREGKRREIGWGVALEVPEVSQEHFLPKTDRATRGCSSYTHTNRATLCHQVANLETYSTCKQHEMSTCINSPEFPCTYLLHGHGSGGNDKYV